MLTPRNTVNCGNSAMALRTSLSMTCRLLTMFITSHEIRKLVIKYHDSEHVNYLVMFMMWKIGGQYGVDTL